MVSGLSSRKLMPTGDQSRDPSRRGYTTFCRIVGDCVRRRWHAPSASTMATVFNFPYRTVAEISLRALLRNLYTLRNLSGKEVIPVIKANAYGHGLLPIGKALVNRGSVTMVAVATLEEGMQVRQAIPRNVQILVLSGFFPHQLDAYVKFRLTPLIHTLTHLKSLQGKKYLPDLHLKIDTGMHRLGILPKQADEAIRVIQKLPVKLSGLATHFAESEVMDSSFVDQQVALFEGLYDKFRDQKVLHTDARIHVANSGGAMRGKAPMANAIRTGISLYGVSPNDRLPHSKDLLPVLDWKTRILSLKEVQAGGTVGYGRTYKAKRKEKIALLPVGYADGYSRALGGKSFVIINGKRSALRGRVSMDLIAVDVTHQSGVKEGQLVTLLGVQGRVGLTAAQMARFAGTISYEILCGISERVPRVYLD